MAGRVARIPIMRPGKLGRMPRRTAPWIHFGGLLPFCTEENARTGLEIHRVSFVIFSAQFWKRDATCRLLLT